jgi:hypothetical protein
MGPSVPDRHFGDAPHAVCELSAHESVSAVFMVDAALRMRSS